MARLIRPLPRTVTRPLSILALIAWVVTMGALVNRFDLLAQFRERALTTREEISIVAMFIGAALLSITTFVLGMRTGVSALQDLDRTPS